MRWKTYDETVSQNLGVWCEETDNIQGHRQGNLGVGHSLVGEIWRETSQIKEQVSELRAERGWNEPVMHRVGAFLARDQPRA